MSDGLLAGILGSLRYNRNVHGWAMELGQYLAIYQLLFADPEATDSPQLSAKRIQAITGVNKLLESKDIPHLVATPTDQDVAWRIGESVRSLVKVLVSSEHFAFLCISEAACWLRQIPTVATSEIHEASMKELARKRVEELTHLPFNIDSEALLDLLLARFPDDLG